MANAYVRMKHPDYDVLRGMLNDVGRGAMDGFLGASGLTGVPLLSPGPGETVPA